MSSLLRPLGVALIFFLAGLLFSLRTSPAPLPLVVAAIVAGAWLIHRGRPAHRSTDAFWGVAVAFVLAGAAAGASAAMRVAGDCRGAIPDGTPVTAVGVLGAGIAPMSGADARPPMLPLERAEVRNGIASCAATVRVRLSSASGTIPAGTLVEVKGEWIAAGPARSDGAWPRNPYYSGYLIADSLLRITPAPISKHPLLRMRGSTESVLRALYPRHSPLTEALVLGRRERLDPALEDRFVRSGLVHLLAISGSHVGLFAVMILILGTAARVPRERLAWACIGAVAVYLAMIGAPASAIRAGIMLSLALLAVVLQRPAAAVPMMAAAAFAILAVWPETVLHIGFQLSFAGVVGILVARRAVLRAIPPRYMRRKFVKPLVESITVSTAAFAATAPIVAHVFGQVAPISIIANLVAGPATALALAGITGSVALYPVIPPLAHLVADGATVALDVLDRTATVAAAVPYGHGPAPRPDWIAWGGAVCVGFIAWDGAGRARRVVRGAAAAGTAAALLIAWPALARGGTGTLELHFIDVGQGDAVAIRTPADRWVLIDAGPRGYDNYDAGARRVLPYLHAYRAARLEALVLTHPDADHIGGAPSVMRGIDVAAVIDPGLPVGKGLYAEVLATTVEQGIEWRRARGGRILNLDGVELRLLWPEVELLDSAMEANEISAVILVTYGDFEALLTGDVSTAVERRIIATHPNLPDAEVLKAGHHGSATSTSSELLDRITPELVVVSAGRRNRYGHPAPVVLDRVRRRGIDIARTDLDGSVVIRVSQGGGSWYRVEH